MPDSISNPPDDSVTATPPPEWSEGDETKRQFDPDTGGGVDRDKLEAGDFVLGDERAFPVVTPGDVQDAVSSWGRYKGAVSFEAFKRRLIALCRRKGPEFVARLPQTWKDEMSKSIDIDMTGEFDGDETKAGRRMSGAQLEKAKGALQVFADLIKWASYKDDEPAEAEDESEDAEEMGKSLVTVGGGLKALGDGMVGGYLVMYGDQDTTDLSAMADFFAHDTDYDLENGTGKATVYYHHGQDPVLKKRRFKNRAELTTDDVGVWMAHQLDLREQYEQAVYGLTEIGKMGLSSGAPPHLVERQPQANGSHKITHWPIAEASYTPIPAEPRIRVMPMKSYLDMAEPYVKALLPQADAIPQASAEDATEATPEPEPTEAKSTDVSRETSETSNGEYEMDDTQLQAVIAQASEKAAADAIKAYEAKLAEAPAINPAGVAVTSPAPETKAFDAIYTMRYGTEDEAMKSIYTDLVGEGYQQTMHEQNRAFVKYLRWGEGELDRNERAVLRRQIFPAEQIKRMVAGGADIDTIKTVMVEAQGTLSGYAVPPNVQAAIVSRLPGMTAVRGSGATVVTLGNGNSVDVPYFSGGDARYPTALRGVWGSETAAPTASNATLGTVPVVAQVYTYKVGMSQSLVEDAANLVDLVQNQIATTLAIDEDDAFLVGDGANKPLGLLPSSANGNSLGTVNTGNATLLTADGLVGLSDGLDTQYQDRASYVFAKATGTAIRKMKDGDGNYLFDRELVNGMRTLIGSPYRRSEAMPAVAASAYPILYGDFSGYWIVEKAGLTIARFQDSATGINSVEYHVRRRVGGRVVETWKFNAQYVSA